MKKIFWGMVFILATVQQAYAEDVTVSKAWTRATAPGQDTAAVHLTITSKRDATLVEAASGSAEHVEIHSMEMEGDVMKMRQLDSLPLPAKQAVTLGEGGNHLMLIGLRAPLKAGHKLPFAVTVKFADGRTTLLRVLAVIKPLEANTEGMHHHHH